MTRYFQFLKTAVILAIAIFIQIAQVRSQSITSPQSTNFMLEAYNIRGRAFVNKDAVNVEGTPLLNTEWGRGEVRFKNGGIVKDIELKFNLERNELYFNKGDELFLFNDPVISFSIQYNHLGKSYQKLFRNGFPLNGRLGNETFYEIIADGDKWQFVNFTFAFLSNANTYGGSSAKQIFTTGDEFYIFDRGSDKMIRTKKSIAGITESMPSMREQITRICTEKKLKLRNNEEVVMLFQALNL